MKSLKVKGEGGTCPSAPKLATPLPVSGEQILQNCCQTRIEILRFFRYDVGSGAAVLTAGTDGRRHVKVGQLHRVTATVVGRNGSLTLDDGDTVVGSSRGALSSLNVQSTLYLGRVPSLRVSAMYVPHGVNMHATTRTLKYSTLQYFRKIEYAV